MNESRSVIIAIRKYIIHFSVIDITNHFCKRFIHLSLTICDQSKKEAAYLLFRDLRIAVTAFHSDPCTDTVDIIPVEVAHLENNGLKYVMRIKTSGGIAHKFNISHNEEADFTANIIITRRQTNEVKTNPELYRYLPQSSTFDFLPKESKDTYPLKFRIIRLRISEDIYETIVTNLCDDEFSAEDIKMIYKMRWGIETSFRELKYQVDLIAFHSKKKDCVIQEIFASLIMYNFSMLITENITIDDDKHNDYRYKINYAFAIHICIKFFRSAHANPFLLEELIARCKW